MTFARLRPLAETDLVERIRYYRREGGEELGTRFFEAAIAALDAISRMPGAGSPRVGEMCDIPSLRFRRVVGFPFGWFYFIATDHIGVVRLLADAQELPSILTGTQPE